MKPTIFLAILAALVALGCASVSREESRRVYDLGGEMPGNLGFCSVCDNPVDSSEAHIWHNGDLLCADCADSDPGNTEASDEGLDSLQIEAKYFGGGK